MSLLISVDNPSLPQWDKDFEALLPRYHRFQDPHPDPSIQLIDVTEMWTGLRDTQPAELRFWHNALRLSVERYVREALLAHLHDADVSADAHQLHAFVLALGHQQIMCDVDWIVEDMIRQQSQAGVASRWWDWDKRVAITNFIRLHHCFFEDQPLLQGFFTSELTVKDGDGTGTGTGVLAYFRTSARPRVFAVDHASGLFSFQSPVLDPNMGFYPVQLSEAKKEKTGDVWNLKVATLFRDGVRFERMFRFRSNMQRHRPTLPRSIAESSQKRILDSARGRKSRKKLREVSLNSVRVQGTSDFERAARESHPQLFRAHLDHSIGKSDILGKLYGSRGQSPERPTTNIMLEDWESTPPQLGTITARVRTEFAALPSSPYPQAHSVDENDSLYAFSPVRPRSFLSPLRSDQCTKTWYADNVFASSPRSLAARLPVQKGKNPLSSSWHSVNPQPLPGTARHGSSAAESDARAVRKRAAGAERESYERVFANGIAGSQGTAEISPPESVDVEI
ncbi:uncharacterized protein PV09_02208 [Verruconis gallopava]|uniref:Uncharacterized protein n=1 Tax=Verruconis gallopava TaxID=253628 RepID=A0A0D1Z336_9PEZI|nr:uncharacterized protein PV09_02208 [Verruconis gallopava]KIW07362.1 hypothetical protein PV09_02208 [Verruconis gallopava]